MGAITLAKIVLVSSACGGILVGKVINDYGKCYAGHYCIDKNDFNNDGKEDIRFSLLHNGENRTNYIFYNVRDGIYRLDNLDKGIEQIKD